MHVNFRSGEWNLLKRVLHLRVPLLHESIKVREGLSVIHSWGRTCLVQVLNTVDPAIDFLWLLICLFNLVDSKWSSAYNIFTLHILKF